MENIIVGLSSWIIADGNYEHFRRGQRASFALAFYPTNASFEIPRDWLTVDPPGVDRVSMRHVEGSQYLITARVTHILDYDGWWVIDAGVPMYRTGLLPEGVEQNSWVSGKIYLGIDPFDYFERLSRYYVAPALIYDWDVTKIELETSPVIVEGRMHTRDRSRSAWQEVDSTQAHCEGALVDEFVLHCARVDVLQRR